MAVFLVIVKPTKPTNEGHCYLFYIKCFALYWAIILLALKRPDGFLRSLLTLRKQYGDGLPVILWILIVY